MEKARKIWTKIKEAISLITVEPALFFIYLSDGMDNIALEQLKIQKACQNEFNFNETVCDNLLSEEYFEENNEIQNSVAQMNSYIVYISFIPSIVLVRIFVYFSFDPFPFPVPRQMKGNKKRKEKEWEKKNNQKIGY